jgi:hypothetical protein
LTKVRILSNGVKKYQKEEAMMSIINPGDRLFHFNPNTKKITGCTAQEIVGKNIIIVLDEIIAGKSKLTLPLSYFGKWLFFEIPHISLSNIDLNDVYACFENERFKIKKDKQKLLERLQEFEFDGFHHYTNISNLFNIFNEGFLYSRGYVESNYINFCDGAQSEIIENTADEVKKCVRLYYKECTPTLFVNEGIKRKPMSSSAHMPIPVLLLFDEKLVYSENAKVSNGGCGNSHSIRTDDFEKAQSFAWQDVFSRGPLPPQECNPKEINNRRNAEFLVPNKVSLNHLKKIIFRSEADRKHADYILGDDKLYQKIYKEINKNKFNVSSGKYPDDDRNYLDDYTIEKKKDKNIIRLTFYKDASNYSHVLRVYYDNGLYEDHRLNEYCDNKKLELIVDGLEGIFKMEYLMNDIISAVWEVTQ